MFVNPINWLPQIIARFKRAQISYKRLEKIYNLEPEKLNEKTILSKEKLKGDILIKDLNFSYLEGSKKVLKNINLSVKKGETIGIIGTIGSRKNYTYEFAYKTIQCAKWKDYDRWKRHQ